MVLEEGEDSLEEVVVGIHERKKERMCRGNLFFIRVFFQPFDKHRKLTFYDFLKQNSSPLTTLVSI
jgi:hypothetical protein